MGIFLYLTHALLGGYLRLAPPVARPVGSPRRPLFQALRHSNARRARPAVSYRIYNECFAVAADRHLPARQVDNNNTTTTTTSATQQQQ